MDLNILTMDLQWICLFDTYPCPALLPFLHGVKLVPRTFCTLGVWRIQRWPFFFHGDWAIKAMQMGVQ